MIVICYFDFDYVGVVDSKKYMKGYLFIFGGYVVSWKVILQLQ